MRLNLYIPLVENIFSKLLEDVPFLGITEKRKPTELNKIFYKDYNCTDNIQVSNNVYNNICKEFFRLWNIKSIHDEDPTNHILDSAKTLLQDIYFRPLGSFTNDYERNNARSMRYYRVLCLTIGTGKSGFGDLVSYDDFGGYNIAFTIMPIIFDEDTGEQTISFNNVQYVETIDAYDRGNFNYSKLCFYMLDTFHLDRNFKPPYNPQTFESSHYYNPSNLDEVHSSVIIFLIKEYPLGDINFHRNYTYGYGYSRPNFKKLDYMDDFPKIFETIGNVTALKEMRPNFKYTNINVLSWRVMTIDIKIEFVERLPL